MANDNFDSTLNTIKLEEKQIQQLQKVLSTNKSSILSIATLKSFSISEPNENDDIDWKKRPKCIACIVNNEMTNIFLKICQLDKKKLIWEFDLSCRRLTNVRYIMVRPLYHILDLDETIGMVAFNFNYTDEAKQFANLIQDKIKQLKMPPENEYDTIDNSDQKFQSNISGSNESLKVLKFIKNLKVQPTKKSFDKNDIGKVYNFAHIHHITYDKEKQNYSYYFRDKDSKYNIFKTRKDIFSGSNLEKLLEVAGVITCEELDLPEIEIVNDKNIEKLEISDGNLELDNYQRDSFYVKASSESKETKTTMDINSVKEEENNINETEIKTDSETQTSSIQTQNVPKNLPRNDILAQIGADAVKAFQQRANRNTLVINDKPNTTTSTTSTNTKAVVVDSILKKTSTPSSRMDELGGEIKIDVTPKRIAPPAPKPRKSKYSENFESNNLPRSTQLDNISEDSDSIHGSVSLEPTQESETIRENLI
ncbi:hypothetical protein BLOT_007216 [Blomia tropicalis]|nr:hypothetical protein BLOT_007216 [Blomia tropicalis]